MSLIKLLLVGRRTSNQDRTEKNSMFGVNHKKAELTGAKSYTNWKRENIGPSGRGKKACYEGALQVRKEVEIK